MCKLEQIQLKHNAGNNDYTVTEKSGGSRLFVTSPNVVPWHVWMFWPTFAITSTILSCVLIVALAPLSLPSCCHLHPAIISALSLAASAVWVLESGEYEVRAGGREETYCQGYASEDDWCQAGLSCQPVRRQECLMFSLLVTLLCIFLCQRRWAIWTAKALQRPAGHLSSPDAPNAQLQLSASDLLWLESRLTDRSSVRGRGILFVSLWKHQCSCNGLQLSEEASTWQLCGLTNLQSWWLALFCLNLVVVLHTNRLASVVHRGRKGWRRLC